MITFKQFLENTENLELPPEMGTAPIPDGCVRLYHQTNPENVPSIKQNGIIKSLSTGKSHNEPSVIWAARKPFYSLKSDLATIELFIPEEQFSPPSYVRVDVVPPEQIIGIHERWNDLARHLIKDYPEPNQSKIDFWMSIDDNYQKATQFYVNYMKSINKL